MPRAPWAPWAPRAPRARAEHLPPGPRGTDAPGVCEFASPDPPRSCLRLQIGSLQEALRRIRQLRSFGGHLLRA
eukprot:4878922-Alexandrium_andersonii.AAC.1